MRVTGALRSRFGGKSGESHACNSRGSVSLSDPTGRDVVRAVWWLGTFAICLYFEALLVWFAAVVLYVAVRMVVWAVRVDRLERDALNEADEIAAIRRFHETIDGTIDLILRRGK